MSSNVSAAFGEVIRDLRIERGLSQEAVSFACGRHRTYVSILERGLSSPSLDTFWNIADALEVQPSTILAMVEARLGSRRRRPGRT